MSIQATQHRLPNSFPVTSLSHIGFGATDVKVSPLPAAQDVLAVVSTTIPQAEPITSSKIAIKVKATGNGVKNVKRYPSSAYKSGHVLPAVSMMSVPVATILYDLTIPPLQVSQIGDGAINVMSFILPVILPPVGVLQVVFMKISAAVIIPYLSSKVFPGDSHNGAGAPNVRV